MRTLLQTHQKLVTRGWNRPRARDYYDLWCILKKYYTAINQVQLIEVLDKKCLHRDVFYKDINDFFTVELCKEAAQHWRATLGGLVRELPNCQLILDETKNLIEEILFLRNSQ